ncbi:hypothetical protein Patl1_06718 [Pistacia atlantica]|uniref:Uncharacterized protein n=1 Tax=Pistacia atlantica TaxID=434234 RepID=A0ACC1BRH0_9ROSI|nr:hypothetical protein Patl1_06718 [Pistacia atlantica]
MASVSLRCGGGAMCSVRLAGIDLHRAQSSMVVMIGRGNDNNKCMNPISMSLARMDSLETKRTKQKRDETISHENVIDEWMKNSVSDIVTNLREAPLLVHVYSDNGHSTRLKTEKAVSEDWPSVKSKWEDGTTPFPEGVIFVKQLKDDKAEKESDSLMGESDFSRAWGILVQANGESCLPACYLLKTSRAGPLAGLGLCCTHFCLMKVKSLRETAEAQLSNCWLLNGH